MPQPRSIEWYRPAITRRMLRILIPCALIVLAAALLIGGGVLYQDGPLSTSLVIIGTLFAIVGPTLAAYGALKFLQHDVYLALRTDGIVFHDEDGSDRFIGWSELDGASSPDADTLQLSVEASEPLVLHERFIGIRNGDLAARIGELHRKALLGVPLR